jgi:hypothetical protein
LCGGNDVEKSKGVDAEPDIAARKQRLRSFDLEPGCMRVA